MAATAMGASEGFVGVDRCGDRVEAGQRVAVIEAMKMEVSVDATVGGIISHVAVTKGAEVSPGQLLVVIEAAEA